MFSFIFHFSLFNLNFLYLKVNFLEPVNFNLKYQKFGINSTSKYLKVTFIGFLSGVAFILAALRVN